MHFRRYNGIKETRYKHFWLYSNDIWPIKINKKSQMKKIKIISVIAFVIVVWGCSLVIMSLAVFS